MVVRPQCKFANAKQCGIGRICKVQQPSLIVDGVALSCRSVTCPKGTATMRAHLEALRERGVLDEQYRVNVDAIKTVRDAHSRVVMDRRDPQTGAISTGRKNKRKRGNEADSADWDHEVYPARVQRQNVLDPDTGEITKHWGLSWAARADERPPGTNKPSVQKKGFLTLPEMQIAVYPEVSRGKNLQLTFSGQKLYMLPKKTQ